AEGEHLWLQVVLMQEQVLGLEHLSTIATMRHLSMTYICQARWKEPQVLSLRLLESCERALGL
ncbi:hypothetical protein BO78DRAFT_317088, partial [Aspergillus sclerotiicarbonarius CBS 121057]